VFQIPSSTNCVSATSSAAAGGVIARPLCRVHWGLPIRYGVNFSA
jgi:hypothetical protein